GVDRRDGVLGLLLQDALADHPRDPADCGIAAVEDAHGGTLTRKEKGPRPLRQGRGPGRVPGTLRAGEGSRRDEGTSRGKDSAPTEILHGDFDFTECLRLAPGAAR